MSEEKTRKKIIERCLKRTKFSTTEIQKLLCAYESTVVNSVVISFLYFLILYRRNMVSVWTE